VRTSNASTWVVSLTLSASLVGACGSGDHNSAATSMDASATDTGAAGRDANASPESAVPGTSDASADMATDAASVDAGGPFALTARAHLLVAETPERYCAADAAGLVSCQSNPTLFADMFDQPPQDPFVTFDENDEQVGCGLTASGSIVCWGHGYNDESPTCSDGGGIFSCDRHPPAGVFTAISVGDQLACAVRADGTLACWTNSGETPDAVPSGTFVDVSIDKEDDSACAIGTDGHVVFWSGGQGPSIVDGPLQIAREANGICVLDKNGMVQCVYGYVMNLTVPTGPFTEIAIGNQHVCGLTPQGHAICTGTGGVAGITPPAGPFVEIASGPDFVCGRTDAARVLCWGGHWGDGG
jgi:hypothetical protein